MRSSSTRAAAPGSAWQLAPQPHATAPAPVQLRRAQVVASLVGEIILCVKESNKKTRVAAYGLLVEIGHALHEAQPPVMVQGEDNMGGERPKPPLHLPTCTPPTHQPCSARLLAPHARLTAAAA